MSESAFDLVTKFIQSPPVQLAAGAALGGIVSASFKKVGDVLNDKTNKEIGRWIKVRNVEAAVVAEQAVHWTETFAKVFDRVLGESHLSWKCFWRSCLATVFVCLLCSVVAFTFVWPEEFTVPEVAWSTVVTAAMLLIFDYASLLETRYVLSLMARWRSSLSIFVLLGFDLVLTGVIGGLPAYLNYRGSENLFAYRSTHILPAHRARRDMQVKLAFPEGEWSMDSKIALFDEKIRAHEQRIADGKDNAANMDALVKTLDVLRNERAWLDKARAWVRHRDEFEAWMLNEGRRVHKTDRVGSAIVLWLPTFFTSVWVWLYAAAGFSLKAVRRFDLGFEWFNTRFDVDKKPLQAIGVVAGVLVMLIYWAFALAFRLVG